MKVLAGDWVEVRSKEEILSTLDKSGCLDALPLMPQMLAYCGRRFKVLSRAYKTCDTVSGHYAGRSLPDGIHLDLRCDSCSPLVVFRCDSELVNSLLAVLGDGTRQPQSIVTGTDFSSGSFSERIS